MRGTNKWLVLVATIFGTFLSALDGTIVTVALPKMQAVFGANLHTIQWVVTGYTLALGVSIPLSGWAADRFGIKKVYIGALAAFMAGSVLCGLAPDATTLILFRVLQGLGGGPLLPLSFALLFAAFPPEESGLASGLFGVPVLFAPAIGPTLGGYLVQYLSWRLIFFVNVPIVLLGIALSALWLRERADRPHARFDLLGFGLIAGGAVSLLYALGNAANDGWGAGNIVGGIALGLALLVAFVPVELRAREPLLELRLFRDPAFGAAALVQWLTFAALFTTTILLSLYFQNLRGLQPFDTGKLLLWQAAVTFLATPLAGAVLNRSGPRPLLVVGMILLVATSWWIAGLATTTSDYTLFILPLMLRGVGLGCTIAPAITAVLGRVAERALPRASALTNVVNQIVISLAIAVVVTVVQRGEAGHQERLAEGARLSNPAFAAAVRGLTALYHHSGLGGASAQRGAIATLYGQLVRVATAEAFTDAFLVTLAIAALGVVLALFVRRPLRTGVGVAA